MSDATDPSTARPPRPRRTSREIIADAVRWAMARGIRVIASANPGVICTSTAACKWEVDPSAPGVSPLGAAILMRQKETILSPLVDRACFLAVGESDRWVEGYSIGIAGFHARPEWARHPAGPVYANGWTAGRDVYTAARLRALVTCRHHTYVRYEADSGCPRCAAEMDEPTQPDTRSEQERAEASDPNLMTPVVPGSHRLGGAARGV